MKHSKTRIVQKYFYIAASTLSLLLISPICTQALFADNAAKAVEVLPVVQFPNYRGMVVKGDNTPWKVTIDAHWSTKWTGKVLSVNNILTDANGKVLLSSNSLQTPDDNALHLSIQPPKDLALGDYKLRVTITESDGKQFQSDAAIHIVKELPKVYIDTQGFTVVDGKRFFPMGIYLGEIKEEYLARVAEGGFNTILSYDWNTKNPSKDEYLNLAEKHHLKVVYSLKDLYPKKDGSYEQAAEWAKAVVKAVQEKSALLAWYTNDELGRDWIPELKERYKLLRELDFEHPTLMIQNKLYDMILEASHTDIVGADPYPVGNVTYGNGTLTMSSSWTKTMHRASRGAKGIWMVPQIMDWKVYQKDWKNHQPTLDEMRNQAYQTIINGATGLIWYSYFDLWFADGSRKADKAVFDKRWLDVTKMAKEINAIPPTILADKKVVLDLPKRPEVEAAAWQDGEEVLLLLANPYYEQKSITFALPAGWQIKDTEQGQIKSTFANGKATFILPRVGSGVFRLVRK